MDLERDVVELWDTRGDGYRAGLFLTETDAWTFCGTEARASGCYIVRPVRVPVVFVLVQEEDNCGPTAVYADLSRAQAALTAARAHPVRNDWSLEVWELQ